MPDPKNEERSHIREYLVKNNIKVGLRDTNTHDPLVTIFALQVWDHRTFANFQDEMETKNENKVSQYGRPA
jgi:hypothetical protein